MRWPLVEMHHTRWQVQLERLFGQYDMHENVREWCGDWYESDYYTKSPVNDPQGPNTGTTRVLRGGSWIDHAAFCRSAVVAILRAVTIMLAFDCFLFHSQRPLGVEIRKWVAEIS